MQEAIFNFVISVCLSVRMKQIGFFWTDFHKILYWIISRKSIENIQFSLKSGKNNGYFTWLSIYICENIFLSSSSSSSSSIGAATLVGLSLLNYRWVFSAGRFLQSVVASSTSNPRLGGPVIRTFQLSPQGVPSVWNDASEPQQRKVWNYGREIAENFA